MGAEKMMKKQQNKKQENPNKNSNNNKQTSNITSTPLYYIQMLFLKNCSLVWY